ncbi:MAG: hypothetical protein JEZ03_12275 [Bacteroidales bacterium]|nr:hypothetical protein [Bacteroidales bacterium]
MKRIVYLLFVSSLLIGFQSCKCKKHAAKHGQKPKVASAQQASPTVILYKTKADYRDLVPVTLNEEKTRIVFYPAASDVVRAGQTMAPTVLQDGYLLDRRGINENVAFLRLTYMEYSKLDPLPHPNALYKLILDKDPVLEMYKCGHANDFKQIDRELNELIKQGKLSKFERIK